MNYKRAMKAVQRLSRDIFSTLRASARTHINMHAFASGKSFTDRDYH